MSSIPVHEDLKAEISADLARGNESNYHALAKKYGVDSVTICSAKQAARAVGITPETNAAINQVVAKLWAAIRIQVESQYAPRLKDLCTQSEQLSVRLDSSEKALTLRQEKLRESLQRSALLKEQIATGESEDGATQEVISGLMKLLERLIQPQ